MLHGKIAAAMLFCFVLLLSNVHKSYAEDVYVCHFEGHEVYVSTEAIYGSQYQFMIPNGVKFVKNGKQAHFATCKFYQRAGGVWWGNVFIDNYPNGGDYPVTADKLTYAIFSLAVQYTFTSPQ